MKKRLSCVLASLLAGAFLCLGQAQPTHFILLGDPQFGMYSSNADVAQEAANYEFAVATVNHRNVLARDGQLEVVATAPVGKPLGQDGSGIRVVTVSEAGLSHCYYEFGKLPDKLVNTNSPSL